jgi:hypothetical protein
MNALLVLNPIKGTFALPDSGQYPRKSNAGNATGSSTTQ